MWREPLVGHGRQAEGVAGNQIVSRATRFDLFAGRVRRLRLRRATDVAMMESADLEQRNDAALFRSLNGARLGRILLESEVGARLVVVAEIAAQATPKVRLVQDDDVVEKLAADGADYSARRRGSARESVVR